MLLEETTVTQPTTSTNPYETLQDISEVRPLEKTGKDAAMMNELFQVLRKYDAVDRIGVNLLHDHFEVNDGEVMIETHDEETRTLTIKPYRNANLKESEIELQETNWRFDEGGSVVAMQVCIIDLNGIHVKFPNNF